MGFEKERISVQEPCTEEFQNKAQRSKHRDPLDPPFPDPPERRSQDGNRRWESEGNQVIEAHEMQSKIQPYGERCIDHKFDYSPELKTSGLVVWLLLLFHLNLSF